MKTLKVTAHVMRTLAALEASAVEDHVDALDAGLYAAAEVLGQRANLWRELAQIASLIDRDQVFASFVADALLRDTAATAQPIEIPAIAQRIEGEKCARCAYGQFRADGLCPICDKRAAALVDARQMLDFLTANPELPFDGLRIQPHLNGTDEEDRQDVDRAAAILGVTAAETGYNGHYEARKKIGRTEYTVVAVPAAGMRDWEAKLRLGEAALAATKAAALDEDQPMPSPASSARGHVQDDDEDFVIVSCSHADCLITDAVRRGQSLYCADHVGDLLGHDEPDDDAGHGDSWIPVQRDGEQTEDADEGTHLTHRQLNGTACTACGLSFAVGEEAVPAGTQNGNQLFVHRDCPEAELR